MRFFVVYVEVTTGLGDGDLCFDMGLPFLISAPTQEEALALVPEYLPDQMCRLSWHLWVERHPDLRQLGTAYWLEVFPDPYGSIVIPKWGRNFEKLNPLLPASKGYLDRVEAWGTERPCDDLRIYEKRNPNDPLDVGR